MLKSRPNFPPISQAMTRRGQLQDQLRHMTIFKSSFEHHISRHQTESGWGPPPPERILARRQEAKQERSGRPRCRRCLSGNLVAVCDLLLGSVPLTPGHGLWLRLGLASVGPGAREPPISLASLSNYCNGPSPGAWARPSYYPKTSVFHSSTHSHSVQLRP